MQTIVLFALLAPVTSFAPVVRESVWTRSVARGVTAKEAYAAAEVTRDWLDH